MTVYYVMKENGSFVCGPFKDKAFAEEVRRGYDGTWCWGRCVLKEKEIEDRK